MSDFDDPRLRQQLGRLSGAFPDENVALVAVQSKARRARRRRAAMLSGGTAVGALVLGVAAFAAQPEAGPVLRPSSTSATGTTDLGGVLPTTTDLTTTAPSTTIAEPTTTVEAATTTSTPVATVAPTAPAVPEQPAGSGTAQPTAPPAGPPPTTPASTPPTNPGGARTFSGQGGSVTVRRQGEWIVLVSSDPAGGFSAEVVDGTGRRIEVRFSSADGHVTRIRVSLENGVLVPDVRESDGGDGHPGGWTGDATPGSGSPDSGGPGGGQGFPTG